MQKHTVSTCIETRIWLYLNPLTIDAPPAVLIPWTLEVAAAEIGRVAAHGWSDLPLLYGLVGAGQELILTSAGSVEVIYRLGVHIIGQPFDAVCVVPEIQSQQSD